MTTETLSQGPSATEELGRRLGQDLVEGGIVYLSGPLGAGKTLLAKGIFSALGVDRDQVTSPSYQLVHRYHSRRRPELALHHVDLFRIERAADLASLGLDEILDDPGVVVVEWAERLGDWPGVEPLQVAIEDLGDDRRLIRVEHPE